MPPELLRGGYFKVTSIAAIAQTEKKMFRGVAQANRMATSQPQVSIKAQELHPRNLSSNLEPRQKTMSRNL